VPLRDPVHIYDAANNQDASLVQMYLERNGIEAFEVEDTSLAGVWMFGFLPGIHRPRVWVDRVNAERAKVLIEEFEVERHERVAEKDATSDDDAPVHVVCEECHKASDFAASKRGTTQDCPHCGAFVDVGDVESFEDEH
jgi:Zn finger protein HypA/HybF involved in hydrogenase expression